MADAKPPTIIDLLPQKTVTAENGWSGFVNEAVNKTPKKVSKQLAAVRAYRRKLTR